LLAHSDEVDKVIFVPQYFYSTDPLELGKALIAWRYGLNREEVVLLGYIAGGFKSKQLLEKLGVAEEKTIRSRIKRLYMKLKVDSRVDATVIAVQFGMVAPKVAGPAPE
jgi:DNA-binding NarL/FixJ family response regulator